MKRCRPVSLALVGPTVFWLGYLFLACGCDSGYDWPEDVTVRVTGQVTAYDGEPRPDVGVVLYTEDHTPPGDVWNPDLRYHGATSTDSAGYYVLVGTVPRCPESDTFVRAETRDIPPEKSGWYYVSCTSESQRRDITF